MHRLPLQKAVLRPCIHQQQHSRLLTTRPLSLGKQQHSTLRRLRPAIVLATQAYRSKGSLALLASTPFHLHSVDKKAVRVGSVDAPATPAEIEHAELTHESRFMLIRLCKRILQFLDDYLLEPILTLRRLTHILLLFLPVAITVPIVFFGQKEDEDEKAGTLWWYDFLATQMERAGPTFIKVSKRLNVCVCAA